MALLMFTVTLFVSAFLLFLVQPLIGKIILPKLGGTPQVWNTCMVFFQMTLLAGYAYTHTLSSYAKIRKQMLIHGILLFIPLIFLLPVPFKYAVDWDPNPNGNPILDTLFRLAITVGIPFFVVSTSAPLLQKWFAYSGDPAAKDPYFLYAASNLGSLLSLLAYPLMIEWIMPVFEQRIFLLGLYVVLGGLVLYCASLVGRIPNLELQVANSNNPPESAAIQQPVALAEQSTAIKAGPARGVTKKKGLKLPGSGLSEHSSIAKPSIFQPRDERVTWWRRIRWVLLAAIPSSLMLGITSYISTDLSPFPLLWVIPLALYLTTFILVFMKMWTGSLPGQHSLAHGEDNADFSPHWFILRFAMPLAIILLAIVLVKGGGFDPVYTTLVLMALFFVVTLGCHGELARDRPGTQYLTEFYLWMSVGGMLGGMFNGIFAPIVFVTVLEFPIAIALAAFVRPKLKETGWFDQLVLDSSPGMQSWVQDQGDEIAKSTGQTPPHSPYLFAYAMDIFLAGFVFCLAYLLGSWLEFYPRNQDDIDRHILTRIIRLAGFRSAGLNVDAERAQVLYKFIVYGIPSIFCFMFSSRPIRFGLGVTAILLVGLYFLAGQDHSLYRGRSYFGVLRVLEEKEGSPQTEIDLFGTGPYRYTYLMHGTTYHGRNYLAPTSTEKEKADLSRLATTYYHRYGPVGIIMEQYNWLPGQQNTFYADARLPTAMLGQLAGDTLFGSLPLGGMLEAWSEPPFATIGLGSGTMASYARPFQYLAYYEIDRKIRNFSLPEEGQETYFSYLQGAMKRGANLEVIMGDARLSMARELDTSAIYPRFEKGINGSSIVLDPSKLVQNRDNFYKVIVVDAFSSDAIPIHLITKEAIEMYLSKLTEDGTLCVHTSNRHLNLVKPVARIVQELNELAVRKNKELIKDNKTAEKDEDIGYRVMVGKDRDKKTYMGLFSSEYVMIYRSKNHKLDDYLTNFEKMKSKQPELPICKSAVDWYSPFETSPREVSSSLWTDDYSNLMGVIRWPWDRH